MKLTSQICVVGSTNIDLFFRTPRLPKTGETLTCDSFQLGHGGKGIDAKGRMHDTFFEGTQDIHVAGFKLATVPCRASAGPCDAVEFCTGTGPSCPGDTFQSAGVPCRAAANSCDVAEVCTGTAVSCPANGFVAAGTLCNPSEIGRAHV